MRFLMLLLVAACAGRSNRPGPQAEPGPQADRCGNGIVDAGEVCDPNVKWAEGCPEPWGMCWKCSPACNARVATASEPLHGIVQAPMCEERLPSGATTVQTYDSKGRLLSRRRTEPGLEDMTLLAYDERGRTVMIESDYRSASMSPQHSRLHHVFEDDRRVRSWQDHDLDGTPDRVWQYTYSDDGRMLREATHDSDRRFSYDSAGNRIGDVGTFPNTEWHSTTQLAYDALGRETHQTSTAGTMKAEPMIECRTTYHAAGSRRCCKLRGTVNSDPCFDRDRFGELVVHEIDGAVTKRYENEYDAHGLLTKQVERLATGEVVATERRTYDAHGNEVVRERDHGTGVTRTEHSYACLADVYTQMPMRAFVERR